MSAQDIACVALVSSGIFFILMAGIGIIRLPDFYSRTHAVSKGDTLRISLVILGLMVHEGFTLNSLKLFYIFVAVSIANPIGSHAIGYAALKRGLKPLLGKSFKKDKGA
jgi:multicomponent Na+:H+ antiporter subunit G